MAEQEQGSSTEQTTSDTQTEQTLEQVYQKFNVEETASQFQQQPVQHQEPQQRQEPSQSANLGADIPDPVLDQAGFKSWLATQNSQLRDTLGHLRQTQQQLAVAEMRRQEESDIRGAVQRVKEKIGDGMDDDFIEIALGQKARRDPKFLSIYQNRHRNPQAWNAALGAVANEFKGKFAFRQDSQLTENVRAARQSTQTSLTARDQSSDNPVEKALSGATTQREFDRLWSEFQRH